MLKYDQISCWFSFINWISGFGLFERVCWQVWVKEIHTFQHKGITFFQNKNNFKVVYYNSKLNLKGMFLKKVLTKTKSFYLNDLRVHFRMAPGPYLSNNESKLNHNNLVQLFARSSTNSFYLLNLVSVRFCHFAVILFKWDIYKLFYHTSYTK